MSLVDRGESYTSITVFYSILQYSIQATLYFCRNIENLEMISLLFSILDCSIFSKSVPCYVDRCVLRTEQSNRVIARMTRHSG